MKMSYLYDDQSIVYQGNESTDKYKYLSVQIWKTAAPPLQKNPQCSAYLIKKQAVMDTSTTHTEAGGTTGTPAVCNLYA